MNAKSLTRNLLLIVVGVSVAWFVTREVRQANAAGHVAENPATVTEPTNSQAHVVMTYFTTNVRCTSCRKIEALARETAEVHHADAMADGRLVFQVINTDEPGLAHYVGKYELVSKTVILSRRQNGEEVEWKNMDEVWSHLNDPAAFSAYLGAQLEQWEAM
jgi:hypothetical protein